jgi:hypothetical protein
VVVFHKSLGIKNDSHRKIFFWEDYQLLMVESLQIRFLFYYNGSMLGGMEKCVLILYIYIMSVHVCLTVYLAYSNLYFAPLQQVYRQIHSLWSVTCSIVIFHGPTMCTTVGRWNIYKCKIFLLYLDKTKGLALFFLFLILVVGWISAFAKVESLREECWNSQCSLFFLL